MAVAAVIGKVLQIVGGIVGTAGQYRSDLARAQQLKFESEMSLRNAQLAKQDIKIVREAGVQERAAISKEELQTRGEARVGFASGNVAVDEGSALDFDVALAEQGAIEREQSRDFQGLAERRLQNEKMGLLAQSALQRKAFKEQKRSARSGLASGALSTVGGAMSMFGGKK